MKTKIYFLLALFLSTGCEIYTTVSVNADTSTDFSQYKTFAWLPDKADTVNSPYNNEIIRNNLKNFFGLSFVDRGYTVDLDAPDMLLQISIINKQREFLIHPRPYYHCRYYYRSEYYFPYHSDYYYHNYLYCYPTWSYPEKIKYVEGSITLNIIDRKQNKLIWSGTAKGDIYDPTYINRSIHPAVELIMKKFPIKSHKKKSSEDMARMNRLQ